MCTEKRVQPSEKDKSDEVSGKSVDDLDIDCGTFVPQNVEIGRFVKIANFFQAITEKPTHNIITSNDVSGL